MPNLPNSVTLTVFVGSLRNLEKYHHTQDRFGLKKATATTLVEDFAIANKIEDRSEARQLALNCW